MIFILIKLFFFKRIVNDKIGGLSIKKQFISDEEWTKALKVMLINLKFLLAAVSRLSSSSASSSFKLLSQSDDESVILQTKSQHSVNS